MKTLRLLPVLLLLPLMVACGSDGDSGGDTPPASGGKGGSGGKAGSGGGVSGASGQGGSAAGGSGGASGQGGSAAGAGGSSGAGAGGSSGAGQGGSAGAGSGGEAGAGAGGEAGSAQGGAGGEAGAGQGGASGAGAGGEAGAAGSAGGCTSSSECDGGVCVGNQCCPSAGQVCGTACCDQGQACVFGACVTPGNDCKTSGDCGNNQYCETALGEGGAGGAGGAGGSAGQSGGAGASGSAPVCSQPLPPSGKCLPLPPVCDASGQPAGCVGKCEYVPKPGKLNAVEKWEWGTKPKQYAGRPDVWSTPTVGRLADANCDGKIDQFDPPNVVFVSGNNESTCCHCNNKVPTSCHTGVLRVLDGRTGEELWSNAVPIQGSPGFSGVSVALGDVDGDKQLDVVAVDGEGVVVAFNGSGKLIAQSDKPIPNGTADIFGWGGGLALGDMDADGFPEIAFGPVVFTTKNIKATGKITRLWVGTQGLGGTAYSTALSFFADMDGAADGHLELVAGRTVYKADGTVLWNRQDIPHGFPAVGDFDGDGKPDEVVVADGKVYLLKGADGTDLMPAVALPGKGQGGPPTVADFNGDKQIDIGVAQQNVYAVVTPDLASKSLKLLWQTENHDLSSSVTGSSVFDFEGDGRAEVIYNDECFLWVFDGVDGSVRFASSTSSFTGTESSVVADIDGDGHAEILMIGNSASPTSWKCMDANGTPTTVNGVTWKKGPGVGSSYRGIKAFGDAANSWVGTRSLWSQHAYYVTNICSGDDSACTAADNSYGAIPKDQKENWTLPWLNNFRQNVQEKGLFNAPDATLSLVVLCEPAAAEVTVRNAGQAPLPAGVTVEVRKAGQAASLGTATTTKVLGPGQTEKLTIALSIKVEESDSFEAFVVIDPTKPLFRECRDDNNKAGPEVPSCIKP